MRRSKHQTKSSEAEIKLRKVRFCRSVVHFSRRIFSHFERLFVAIRAAFIVKYAVHLAEIIEILDKLLWIHCTRCQWRCHSLN